ncbi:MAG: ATP-binding cassette domain-containing protein [Chitinophagales bacterium]|nr:ATP-binding cassette domain-containing protein [Chitinophagales bacterium]
MSNQQAVANIKNLQVYQEDSEILSNINIEICKGDFIYIVGKTGSGKSSFLKTMYGDLRIKSAGTVEVAGYDLKNIKSSQIPFFRRKIGIIFQDFQLLTDRNVEQNLKFVLQATGWEDKVLINNKIKEALELVGLSHKLNSMPHQMSGGEQQRVVIARALLNNPEIILADEPTGNLDPKTTEDIMHLLFDVHKELGTPVLMATHNLQLIDQFPGTVYICSNKKLNHVVMKPGQHSSDADDEDF